MDPHLVEPHKHEPKQHRDGKPPWCRECGLTADFKIPESSIGKGTSSENATGGA